MNNISKIKAIGLAALLGVTSASCDLDLLPLNEVVLENYWKEEADVQSVVNSCYVGMTQGDYVEKIITWGELRSDNVAPGIDAPENLRQMMKGNILETNSVCTWNAFYNVINRCNTVTHYAPQVADRDPNFTQQDLNRSLAEVKTLRALSYFYLIRTFRDVPFTFEPSIDDFQNYKLKASKHEDILNAIIADIDKPEVINALPLMVVNSKLTTGTITRPAVWTLLADLYLWKASNKELSVANVAEQQDAYRRCIEYCDKVLNFKTEQFERNDYKVYKSQLDENVEDIYGYQLLAEESPSYPGMVAMATDAIFGTGNSVESIFELTYSTGADAVHNEAVHYMYGGMDADNKLIRKVMGNGLLISEKPTDKFDDTKLFSINTDYRALTSYIYKDNEDGKILKYMYSTFNNSNKTSSNYIATGNDWTPVNSNLEPATVLDLAGMNWIVYRITEVMLMRAEAEINLSQSLGQGNPTGEYVEAERRNGSELSTVDEYYQDAFNLISAVYLRSNPSTATATDKRPEYKSFKSYSKMMNLLEKERQREFLFEGKRYYDLVRRARRDGNNDHFAETLRNKYAQAPTAVVIKMQMPDFMYMPYHATQLDVNPNLKQNPAYAVSDDVVKN